MPVPATIAAMLAHIGMLTLSFSCTENAIGPRLALCVSVRFLRIAKAADGQAEHACGDEHDADEFCCVHDDAFNVIVIVEMVSRPSTGTD
jgi:hypothetical protein